MNHSSGIITSEETFNRVSNMMNYLNKVRDYLKIDTPSDILKDIDSDTEDEQLTIEQLEERKRRVKVCKLLMEKLLNKELPPIDKFDPKDLL